MKYSFSLAALAAVASAYDYGYDYELKFTSIYNITATPEQVVASTGYYPSPGQPGAKGQFNYAIDCEHDVICYDITLYGVTGDYQSPAKTATHIHEGVKGKPGPPRIVFPNPTPIDYSGHTRRSHGCLKGPFVTGVKGADNTTDTGYGFKLSQIEANPAGFFTDTHTVQYLAGAVRGQLDQDYKIIKGSYPPYEDGSIITTATYTKYEDVTVTKCPAEKTYCPGEYYPVVTKTANVYTTVCPKSEVPYYPHETKTYVYKPHETPVYPVSSYKPHETVYVSKPVDTAVYKPVVTYPVDTVIHKPVVPTSYVKPVVPTKGLEYTGAASANKIGGALMVVGLVAALL